VFAIPGIAALMVFILARPQEFILLLQRVPFLHLFTALAVLGWVIDIRLRRLQPMAVPTLPWVIGFFLWAFVGTAVVAPEHLIERGIEFSILFALYGTIAHGVQTFRTFQIIAGVLMVTCVFIAAVCFHQGLADKGCVAGEEDDGAVLGTPDGRECDNAEQCRGPDAEPGKEYRCEHIGKFGTYSVEERVRYRGELHDPNEVAMTISAGALSLLIAFSLRKRTTLAVTLFAAAFGMTVAALWMTQSRGGLISMLLVPGVYLVRRYGFRAIVPAAMLAIPVLLAGGRSDANAAMSTQERYEAWATGLSMFKRSPIFGVGARLFNEHHYITAHNSFVLTLAETGLLGMILFVSILYLSMKMLIVGMRSLSSIPGARVAQVWGMALLASLSGISFQIMTLSFAYHSVLWIFLGMVGAWYSCVKHHQPDFSIRLSWRDLGFIVIGCLAYVFVVLPLFLKAKGEM
jgi:hypothetical protein